MLPDNSRYLVAAAQARAEATHQRAAAAVQALVDAGDPVTFQAVAVKAGVSRAWLYKTPQICQEIQRRRPETPTATATRSRQPASKASLLTRLEITQQRLKVALAANADLHLQLERALGAARTARQSWSSTDR